MAEPGSQHVSTDEELMNRVLRPAVLITLTAVALYLCWLLSAPFLSPFTWALALAVAFAPLQRRLSRHMPPSAAALLLVILAVLIVAVPLTFLSRQLYFETAKAQTFLRETLRNNDWKSAAAGHKSLSAIFVWADEQMDLGEMLQQFTSTAAGAVAPVVAQSLGVLSAFGVALMAFFFFVRDEEVMLGTLRHMLPLDGAETDLLFTRIGAAVQSAVYGRLLIGMLQGALGGVIFALVGLPAPLFWGAVMSLLSTLPVVGAFIVWIPACAFLLTGGHWQKALIVAIWGIAVINPVDNLLYPVLVGARLGMHSLVLFVAFVGGLIALGPAGLILGPCIFAFAAGIAEIWHLRSQARLMISPTDRN